MAQSLDPTRPAPRIATGIYPAVAVLGIATQYNQVFGVAGPTSTRTVWAAQYAGAGPQQVMVRTLPAGGQPTGAAGPFSAGTAAASPDSSARRSMPLVVLSGFSFRNTTATSASSANGVATRNRSAVATP